MILAVGGDGTASEAANGIFDAGKGRSARASLAPISLGTGCDLMRSLAPGRSPSEFCEALRKCSSRTIDTAKVSFVNHAGMPESRIFLNVASCGCSAEVARIISKPEKWLGAKVGFRLAAARALARYRDKTLRVALDGGEAQTVGVTSAAVCNARFFGGGMMISPMASTCDGCLDLTIWSGYALTDFMMRQAMLYDGRHLADPRTSTARAGLLKMTSEEPVSLEVDGEYAGSLPATFRVMPSSLDVIAPGVENA